MSSDDAKSRLRPWEALGTDRVYRGRIFALDRRRCVSPRHGTTHDFDVIDSCDWVNIVPITPDRRVVMVRQYRHGIAGFTLEVPGGMVDPDESPAAAARREMIEESGYDGSDVVELGSIHPNPAFLNNRCHSFLARDVRHVRAPEFDGTEETEVVLVPLEEIPDRIRDGTITHALVVVAFHWLALADER
jgi:ADP-ribose pyrophosphatase